MIELQTETDLFGDDIAGSVKIDRALLAAGLYANLKDISLEEFVSYFMNRFEATVDYVNLCAGAKTGQRISMLFNPHRLDVSQKSRPNTLYTSLKRPDWCNNLARVVMLNNEKTKDILYASVGLGVGNVGFLQEFPPHVARDLALEYGLTRSSRVLDPCAGWGGRMIGFSTVVDSYTCCEPSTRTAAGLRKLHDWLRVFRSDFSATIHELPFEDVELPSASFDFALTSPPYYDTERYADEPTNSFNRYHSFDAWCNGFYAPLIHRTMAALKPGAAFVLNIGSRVYPLNDRLHQIAHGHYSVEKQKGKLSASNGLGKDGEGERFYEIRNPAGTIVVLSAPAVEPMSEPSVPTKLLLAKPEPQKRPSALAFAFRQAEPLPTVLSAPEPPEAPSLPPVPEPQPEPILPAEQAFSAQSFASSLATRGHWLLTRDGRFFVSDAGRLTAEDRAAIKVHREALIQLAEEWTDGERTASDHPGARASGTSTIKDAKHDTGRVLLEADEEHRGCYATIGEEAHRDSLTPCQRGRHSSTRYSEPMQHEDCVNVQEICTVCGMTIAEVSWTQAAWDEKHPKEAIDDTNTMGVTTGNDLRPLPAEALQDASQASNAPHDRGADSNAHMSTSLFDTPRPTQTLAQFLGSEPPRVEVNYRPDEPPDLTNVDTLEFDTETDGLRWWENDRPISLSCRRPDGSTFYLPWGHTGGNLDEATVKRWCERELRNKHLVGANIKFDVNMMKSWGIDLEEQGCTLGDVQIYAALLDDSRKKFKLDILAKDFLGKEKTGAELDKTRMRSYHASEVADYAKTDVALTGELRAVMMPLLDAEDLQRVRQLEDNVIYPVCEMERNGAPLDMELLDRWVKESETTYNGILWQLAKEVGSSINPDAPQDMLKLFDYLHIPVTRLASGSPSFTDAILKRIDHPLVKLARRALKLSDLRSRYLLKYQKAVSSDGILRYAMHQTRYQKDTGEEGGVGPGRFSSAEIDDGVGCNIQQVYKLSKQRKAFGYSPKDATHDDEIHLIRKLMVPREGQWLSADLMQVEFRLFSHYAGNQTLLQAYRDDPLMSFHDKAVEMVRPHYPDVIYDEQKNWTFAYLYGAKTIKQAVMMDFITEEEGQIIREAKDWNSPKLARTQKIASAFNGAIPEAERLMKKCAKLAEERGWIKTIKGRRSRFTKGDAFHKSMNNLLQGGAADYMKEKLIEVHRERKSTGFLLRISVHDELDGDAREPDTLMKVQAILDRQSWPELRVHLLWDVGLGANWAEAK